jgi:serine/threonine protein phosphatase 1
MSRLLAIGDIHGCSRAFDALIQFVQPTASDQIITLGDYIDRGPDSRGVLDRLIHLHSQFTVTSLRGNHEIMMFSARRDAESREFWLAVGGREALASYTRRGRRGRMEDIPEEHWHFLRHVCVDWFEWGQFFFVHANVDPDLPLDQQPSSMLHWEFFNVYSPPHYSGKFMVCGHSEQRHGWPLVLPYAACIDTFCYGGGWLTCLDLSTGTIYQANQNGEVREGQLTQAPA